MLFSLRFLHPNGKWRIRGRFTKINHAIACMNDKCQWRLCEYEEGNSLIVRVKSAKQAAAYEEFSNEWKKVRTGDSTTFIWKIVTNEWKEEF